METELYLMVFLPNLPPQSTRERTVGLLQAGEDPPQKPGILFQNYQGHEDKGKNL